MNKKEEFDEIESSLIRIVNSVIKIDINNNELVNQNINSLFKRRKELAFYYFKVKNDEVCDEIIRSIFRINEELGYLIGIQQRQFSLFNEKQNLSFQTSAIESSKKLKSIFEKEGVIN